MSLKRAVIFVDGSHLHNQLKAIGLQEKHINWEKFFSAITPEDCSLIRAYWYQVARLSPIKWYPNQFERNCPPDMSVEEFEDRCKRWYDDESKRLRDMHDFLYNAICLNNNYIEFRYTGVLRVNPYRMERLGEKGLDVGMAVDMVTRTGLYDVAVIMAGDYDFAPALQYVKDQLNQVHFVMLQRGEPGMDRGGARNLRVIVDSVDIVYESEIKDTTDGFLLEQIPEEMRDLREPRGLDRQE